MKHQYGFAVLTAALFLSACPDGETDLPEQCLVTYKMYPEDGASRAYYRTSVDAAFNQVVDGATLTLVDSSGADVAGATAWDSKRLVFTPAAPLAPGASYTATINFECIGETQNESVTWTVSEVGGVTDLDAVVGSSYALDLKNARYLKPDGLGDLVGQFLTFDILLSVKDHTAGDLDVFGALGVDGQPGKQAPCTETIDFPTADASANPYFELGPQLFEVTVADTEVTIEDLYLSGSFAPDGSYIDGAILSGIIDTRPFASLVEDDPDAPDDAVCKLAESVEIDCVACPDGSGDFCLELVADSISAVSDGIDALVEIPDPCVLDECKDDDACK
ncbi:MAG: Ig-like domain-containing protein [Myxococcota bacterium]